MQSPPPALLPILRSAFQGEMLAWLYLHPDAEVSVTELAARYDVSSATASREADRLLSGGLITERRHGNLRLLRANTETPVAAPLTELLAVTYGPVAVLGELLGPVSGVEAAYIYGSWAARHHGQAGPVPRDVDVLVVGNADDDALYDVARSAEARLGREINIHRVSATAWAETAGNAFLTSVRESPLTPLTLTRETP
jgi:DNA-binding transcriptional ArsR family regulator